MIKSDLNSLAVGKPFATPRSASYCMLSSTAINLSAASISVVPCPAICSSRITVLNSARLSAFASAPKSKLSFSKVFLYVSTAGSFGFLESAACPPICLGDAKNQIQLNRESISFLCSGADFITRSYAFVLAPAGLLPSYQPQSGHTSGSVTL